MNWKLILSLLIAGALFVAPGCGDDDDDGSAGSSAAGSSGSAGGSAAGSSGSAAGSGGGGSAAEVVKETIAAADGGSVATDGDTAKMVIPAGALSDDTEISIAILAKDDLPDAQNLGSDAFDIGPDGTVFDKPVTLTLKLEGSVPADMEAKLAVLNGDKWEVIADSSVSGSEVSAEIEHLSTFVIIFVDGQAVVINPDCAEFEFSPCGGNLVGTWDILDMCMSANLGDSPFADYPECANGIYEMNMDFTGTVEFTADGNYTSEVTMAGGSATSVFTEECMLAMWKAGGADTCDAISTESNVCTYADSECTCVQQMDTGSGGTSTETGTYTSDGNSLTLTAEGGESKPTEYCISGDKGTFGVSSDGSQDGSFDYIILQKK